MINELASLEGQLSQLSPEERLRVARWLVDSVLNETPTLTVEPASALLAWAGRFSGGPGDTAEKAEEILKQEVGRNGFGDPQ
jgi:hypothetical protein